jgi:hypothetical protein
VFLLLEETMHNEQSKHMIGNAIAHDKMPFPLWLCEEMEKDKPTHEH